jgi:spore cortex formation protein SpoVR/YcgB (stage V sporulation)|tara:strand:+ start:497 stop:661 length:165 start_codon:yes stop_codon:yes gene_type:complete
MCECPKIHFYEVEFKLDGMIVVPTHKNCGVMLNEKQNDTFQKELMKSWGFPEEG